jgi:hypothetical protein
MALLNQAGPMVLEFVKDNWVGLAAMAFIFTPNRVYLQFIRRLTPTQQKVA